MVKCRILGILIIEICSSAHPGCNDDNCFKSFSDKVEVHILLFGNAFDLEENLYIINSRLELLAGTI